MPFKICSHEFTPQHGCFSPQQVQASWVYQESGTMGGDKRGVYKGVILMHGEIWVASWKSRSVFGGGTVLLRTRQRGMRGWIKGWKMITGGEEVKTPKGQITRWINYPCWCLRVNSWLFSPQPSFPVVVPLSHYQSQKPRVIFDSSPSPPIHQVLLLPPPKSGHFISPQLVFHSSPPAPSFPGYSINRTAGVPASILDLFSSVFQSIWNKHLDFSWLLGTALTSA